eukprot:jgi/Chlat1/4749/Chrsp308S04738
MANSLMRPSRFTLCATASIVPPPTSSTTYWSPFLNFRSPTPLAVQGSCLGFKAYQQFERAGLVIRATSVLRPWCFWLRSSMANLPIKRRKSAMTRLVSSSPPADVARLAESFIVRHLSACGKTAYA